MSSLPKFIIGDSPDGRVFVVHLHRPRMLLEANSVAELKCVEMYEAELLSATELAAVCRAAGEFYINEIERE